VSSRLAAALCAVTVAGALVTAVSAPAYAATATASPIRYVLPATDRATDVLAVGSEVWVAAGNSILIASPVTGQVRKTVTGVLGATGLALAPDGQSVYVSSSTASRIVQVGVAGDVLGSWPSQACPGKSAIVGGALYYAYGCDSNGHGVGRMDLATQEDASLLTDYSAQSLTAAGSTLVTYTAGSGGPVTSYAVGADGSLTKNATVFADTVYDAELSPSGTELIVTSYGGGYGVARYNAATLAPAGTFATDPYPDAVAWSPDGSEFAGVQNAHYDSAPVRVFADSDGSPVMTTTGAGTLDYASSAHEASWSADGKYLYSVAQSYSGPPTLVVTPTAGQARSTVTVAVRAAAAYGKNATVTVTAARRAHMPVTVTVTQNGTATSRTLTTDAAGVATWSLPVRADGTVTASAGATLAYLAATGSAKFTTPSALTGKLTGYARMTGGVAHYSSVSKVRDLLQILPARPGKVTVSLQHRSGSSWRTDQTQTFATAANGTELIILKRGSRKVTYRLVARAVADAAAGASPSVTSPSFVVD
jgi:hypothetical protein